MADAEVDGDLSALNLNQRFADPRQNVFFGHAFTLAQPRLGLELQRFWCSQIGKHSSARIKKVHLVDAPTEGQAQASGVLIVSGGV
jgi:hypothetical protein